MSDTHDALLKNETTETENVPENDVLYEQDIKWEYKVPEESLVGPFYKTQEVANRIGVDRQTVLRYATFFKDFLSIKVKPSGDRMFTEKAISEIRFLLNDRVKNNRSMQQELDYIQSKYGSLELRTAAGGAKAMEELFKAMQDTLLSSNRELFNELVSQSTLKISESNNNMERIEQRLMQQEERYSKALENRDDEIAELRKQLAEKDKQLEETKKKLPFWKK